MNGASLLPQPSLQAPKHNPQIRKHRDRSTWQFQGGGQRGHINAFTEDKAGCMRGGKTSCGYVGRDKAEGTGIHQLEQTR